MRAGTARTLRIISGKSKVGVADTNRRRRILGRTTAWAGGEGFKFEEGRVGRWDGWRGERARWESVVMGWGGLWWRGWELGGEWDDAGTEGG